MVRTRADKAHDGGFVLTTRVNREALGLASQGEHDQPFEWREITLLRPDIRNPDIDAGGPMRRQGRKSNQIRYARRMVT
jgi:hypothetical protein